MGLKCMRWHRQTSDSKANAAMFKNWPFGFLDWSPRPCTVVVCPAKRPVGTPYSRALAKVQIG